MSDAGTEDDVNADAVWDEVRRKREETADLGAEAGADFTPRDRISAPTHRKTTVDYT